MGESIIFRLIGRLIVLWKINSSKLFQSDSALGIHASLTFDLLSLCCVENNKFLRFVGRLVVFNDNYKYI